MKSDGKYEKYDNYEKSYKTDKSDKYEKYEKQEPKKFTGSMGAADNTKVKPTKNYLEADSSVKYKEEEAQIEKPKFVGKGEEPHFKDITQNEDVNYPINSTLVILEKNDRKERLH